MRKFYLLFAALFASTMIATAGTKNLYKQDFESAGTPANAGWKSPNLAGGMSLQSTEYGTWFRFDLGGNNNRNAVLDFNYGREAGIFEGQDVKEYTVKFQWGLVRNPNDASKPQDVQYSTEVALLGGNWDSNLKSKGYFINNGQYTTADSLCIFAITQVKGAYDAKNPDANPLFLGPEDTDHAFDFVVNRDTANATITLAEGMWYDIEVTVNTETKETSWKISELEGAEVKSGTTKLADNCDPFVKGLNVLLGRRYSTADIDEVKVQANTEGDYANTPTISLTAVDMKKRSFDIYFETGEILHVKKTEGGEDTAVESPYKYETETSGTLEVWTESGTATSEHVTYDIVAEPIALPAAKIDITKVNAGYVKTLLMTVDNTNVLTQPTITLTWEYSNGDKNPGDEVASGAKYEASEKGTLKVTTHAYGFVPTETTFENNTEFAVDKTIDFQHMEEAALLEKGFTEIDPLQSSATSGETNWTGRKRLWFGIENGEKNDDGTAKYDTYVVYGPEGASECVEAIRRFTLTPDKLTKEVASTMFAPVVTWYTGQANPEVADGTDVGGMKFNYGIGMINDGVSGGQEKINYANAPITIDGLTDNDYFIVYVISDYGSSSMHPVYPQGTTVADGKALYKAENLGDGTNVQVLRGTETFSLYRIDTAIARIDIFKAVGGTGIETLPYNQVVSDHNAPVYNLNGVQVTTLKKGIYIKQGKKFIVK
ncbi:MAG: hypothetical protein K6E67_08010 [Prevotella sp.]|nr:hypothetical protein [Prevotella sp.]